jgi:IS5 family transposase
LQGFDGFGPGTLQIHFLDSVESRSMILFFASEGTMRPKQQRTTGSGDLFRARLDQIINMKHELVQLAGKLDWAWIDGEIAPLYSAHGRPGIETRFVIGLLLLKHIYALSDEGVCDRWVHDPYFQYFTGEEFFQHEFPHERSDLSHWRKRLGDKLELLLAESLRVAHESGALRKEDLARVTVDTTVQPKNVTFPTDAKLLHAAIKGLNRLAREHGVRLRQSYLRIAKRAAMMAGRYAHAKQFNRHRRQLSLLRTRLGRLIRDIGRKIGGQVDLEAAFEWPLTKANQIRSQQQRQRGWKLYSFHAPEVECIGKGKASAPYEFGVKVSVVTTNARAPGGQFVLHARALPGNPYDGHTLAPIIEETQRLTGRVIERAYVDKGYRGHDTPQSHRVFISGQKRGVFGRIKRELRRRSAIEPVIGHMKADGHLGRCYLKGRTGDAANAVLTAVGHNLRLVLAWLRTLLTQILRALLPNLLPKPILKWDS